MKTIILVLAAMLIATAADAQQYVNGYTKSNGAYVQGYYRSTPDGNPTNNYSTQGNVNPYTGQPGTKSPYTQDPSYWNNSGGGYNQTLGGSNNSLLGGGQCTGVLC